MFHVEHKRRDMEKLKIFNVPHFACQHCDMLIKVEDGFCENCEKCYQIEQRGEEYFAKIVNRMIKTRMLLAIEPKSEPIFLLISGIRAPITKKINQEDLLEIEADYIEGRCPEMIFQKVQYVSYRGNTDPHDLFELLGVEEGEMDAEDLKPMIKKFHVEQQKA
jgi:hypothetical protein